jgi:hypothetical protein
MLLETTYLIGRLSWKKPVHGHGLSFSVEEAKAAKNLPITNNFYAPVASVAQGINTISTISQANSSATPQEIGQVIATVLQALRNTRTLSLMRLMLRQI